MITPYQIDFMVNLILHELETKPTKTYHIGKNWSFYNKKFPDGSSVSWGDLVEPLRKALRSYKVSVKRYDLTETLDTDIFLKFRKEH